MENKYLDLCKELEILLEKSNLVNNLKITDADSESLKNLIDEYMENIIKQNRLNKYNFLQNPSVKNYNRICVHNIHKKTLHDNIKYRYKIYEPDLTTFLGKLDHLIASLLVYVPS